MVKKFVPTQEIVEIETIKEGVVVLRNGGLRSIIAVDGLNLELRSQEEQKVIANQFQDFLNALDFPIEIVIHSRQINLADYIKHLESKLNKQRNELLLTQLREYIEFLKYLSNTGNIMKKEFFVVVPYDPVIVSQKGLFDFLSFSKGKKSKQPVIKESFDEKKFQLEQRVRVVEGSLGTLGLETMVLTTQQIIEIFYNLYNPGLIEKSNLEILKEVSQNEER